jgi:hypothetical protein
MTSVPSTQVEPTAVYLPNNRRLAEQIAAANLPFPESAGRVVLRGEDIPLVMNRIARRSQAAVGITGDDLLDDWLAAGNELDERVTRSRILWNDARAVYGKPAVGSNRRTPASPFVPATRTSRRGFSSRPTARRRCST